MNLKTGFKYVPYMTQHLLCTFNHNTQLKDCIQIQTCTGCALLSYFETVSLYDFC